MINRLKLKQRGHFFPSRCPGRLERESVHRVKPCHGVFWLNDDRDKPKFIPEFAFTAPEWESNQKDSDDNKIETTRDLEDFQQIAIKVPASIKDKIVNQNYKLAIQTTGGVQVNVFKATQTGRSYLFDQNVATNQVSGTYTVTAGGAPKKFGETVDLNDLSASIKPEEYDNPVPFIFEGKTGGTGTIKLVLKKPDDTVELSDEVHVKLLDVKAMYERAKGTPENGFGFPYDTDNTVPAIGSSPVTPPAFQKPPDETQQCIVFVHGWNLTPFERVNFAETMFKRLWLVGYKGRFAAYSWPPYFAGATGKDFNASEHRAFKYATGLANYVTQLRQGLGSGYTMNLAAHSQGNTVASEAVKQGLQINNFVLMQGAIPASCYDVNAPPLPILVTEDAKPGHATPLNASQGGYRGYFQNVAGNLINYFNAVDFALEHGTIPEGGFGVQANWINIQKKYKPYDPSGGGRYVWIAPTSQFDYAAPFKANRVLNDPHESMSMVSRSRTKAVGAEGATDGPFDPTKSVDLQTTFGFNNTRFDHSGQFYRNIQQNMKPFYSRLMTDFGLTPTQ